jgi:hypothetical protein
VVFFPSWSLVRRPIAVVTSPRISLKAIPAKYSNTLFGNQDMRHHHTATEQGDGWLARVDRAADIAREPTDLNVQIFADN